LWRHIAISNYRTFANERYAAIFVFVVCIMVRIIPELVAYPFPIGYDVVNYYIPVVANFDQHWPIVVTQFPLYVLILHFVNLATGLSDHSTVVIVAITMFGVFGVSLFYSGRTFFGLRLWESIFLAIFAIFQMAILRTAWDLHRDIFALTTMLLSFSLVRRRVTNMKTIIAILALATLTVAADRMVGILFCISLLAWALIDRDRFTALLTVFATSIFAVLLISSFYANFNVSPSAIEISAKNTQSFYNPQNLMVLFVVVNGLLAAPASIGFIYAKSNLFKIVLCLSLIASFSWLVFPDLGQLVADRWIVLAGIFLSVFAAYGIIYLIRKLKVTHAIIAASFGLAVFAAIGLGYASMSYDRPFFLYALARPYIEDFAPVTMQFNALDVQDNDKLLSAITWINENTEHEAIIVGEKHWRGWMEVELENNRHYLYAENLTNLVKAVTQKNVEHSYLIALHNEQTPLTSIDWNMTYLYGNDSFIIYRLR